MGSISITSLLGLYNVREFGLVPRATADNAPAVQAAIEAAHAAGGGQVWLPADVRTVGIGSMVVLYDDVELVIPAGVTLKLLTGANCDLVANADQTNGNSRVRISGAGTIDGNRVNQTEASNGVNIVKGTDCRVEGVTIKGCYTSGLVLDGCMRPVVDVIATDNGTHGIALVDTTHGVIHPCSYDNSKVADAGDGDGINLSGASTDNVILGPVCYDSAAAESKRQGYGVREAAASSCDRNTIVGGSLAGNLTGTASLVGSSSKLADTAATIAQAGTPANVSTAAALGTSPNAAPLDHVHKIEDGAIATAKLAAGAVTQATIATGSASGPTTTSASMVDLPDMSCTLTTTGGDIEVEFAGVFAQSVPGNWIQVALSLDGAAEQFYMLIYPSTAAFYATVATIGRFTGVAAGSHTVKARWSTQGGTATNYGTVRTLRMKEIKR